MTDVKSLIDLSKLTEPATVLIEKISNAVGILYEPRRIIKMAQAQAHCNLINYNSQRTLNELESKALSSLIARETVKQNNIEKITANALTTLTGDATPEDISNDWLCYFFNHCDSISEPEMQRVWGEILSRKSSDTTAYSKKTLSILATLEPHDAEIFTNFCTFAMIHKEIPELYILDIEHDLYRSIEVNFGNALHLQSLGLVHYSSGGYAINVTDTLQNDEDDEDIFRVSMQYFKTKLEVTVPKEERPHVINDKVNISTGEVSLTSTGIELYNLCSANPHPKFVSYWREHLKRERRDVQIIL